MSLNLLRVTIFTFFGLVLFCCKSIGQSNSYFHAEVEAGAVISSKSFAPFWLRANQYGVIPNDAPAGIIQAKIYRDYKSRDSVSKSKRAFDWGFVVNPVLSYANKNKLGVILPEAHAKVRFRNVEFYAGRRRELMGLGDSTLTSGFYTGSGNAIPIPKVQIGTIGYAPIAFKGFISMNAAFSHGWINTPPYIYAARLHQKHLYFKLGKPKSGTKFYFGINHQVLWAGHSEYLKQNPELAINGRLPDSWSFYQYVVLGYTPKDWYKKAGYISFDSYRMGNHLGSYDAALETNVGENKFLIYHQHPYEDVSSLIFKNAPDGLWGINWQPKGQVQAQNFRLVRVTAEFLTTKLQSGSRWFMPGSSYQGGDNYFNHSQYTEGWSYLGQTIGTPFIAPKKDLDQTKFLAQRFFPNNRLNMWYLGLQGKYGQNLLLTVRASYSQNFGIYGEPFVPVRNQFSSLLMAQLKVRQWNNIQLNAKLAVDNGELFHNSFGGYIGVKKSW